MALEAPYGERLLLPVELFPNAGGGFGFGVTKKTSMPEGYDRTLNMSVRDGDILSPSFGVTKTVVAGGGTPPASSVGAWKTGAAAMPFAFVTFAGSSNTFANLFNGVFNLETTGAGGPLAPYTFHDNGAGTEFLYCGQQVTTLYILRRDSGGAWTLASGAGQLVTGKFLVSAAGALWRTINDYQISKCPAGSEPFTLASWGAAIQVGTNSAVITALGALGAAPVVFRTDGIWAYNAADNLFENQFPVDQHPDNFPFVKPDGAGGLYSALHDGSIVHIFRNGMIDVVHPLKGKTPGRDTPRGPITDMAIWGDRILAIMGPAYRVVQPPGLVFLKTTDNMATFTDYSTQVVDRDLTSVADIGGLPTGAAGGYILVGFDQPILAVQFVMNLNAGVNATVTAQISTGAGAWATVATDNQDIRKATTSEVFGKSGVLTISAAAVTSAWALVTYNGTNKYWLRLSMGNAVAAGTTISSVAVVIQRPAPNFGQTNTPNSPSWEASGMEAKILIGTTKPGGLIWDDLYTLNADAIGCKLTVSQLPMVNSPGASLVAYGASNFHQFPLPNILESSVVEYPDLARDAAGKLAPIFYPSAVDLGTVHFLRYVEIIGANLVEGVDSWGFSWRWDDRNAWDNDKTGTGKIASTSALFKIDDQIGGTVLHTAIQLLDANNTDPVGPSGRKIICWVEAAPIRASQQVEPTRTLVEVS